jgi:hypothetical protein
MSNYPGKIITNNADAGYSVVFDGTGDYLSVAHNTALDLGSGDFCIEFFIYKLNSTLATVITKRPNYTTAGYPNLYIDANNKVNIEFAAGVSLQTAGTIRSNAWDHVAIVKNGTGSNNVKCYINGTADTNTASVTSVTSNTNALLLGGDTNNFVLTGFLSNVRVVKGSPVYTANFPVPTQLLNITNTSLLACNAPTIVDQSSNTFPITVNGDTKVSTFTPFTAYNPYTPELGCASPGIWSLNEMMEQVLTRRSNAYDPYFSYNSLLIHGAGTNGAQNNTFLDSSTANSGSAWPITRNGNVYQGNFTPFSAMGWSTYVDGNVTFSNPAGLVTAFAGWGGRTRTFETWLFREDSSNCNLQAAYGAVAANGRWFILIESNKLVFGWTTSTSSQTSVTSVNSIPVGAWVHLAVVVDSTTSSSTTIRLCINGNAETFTGQNLSTQTSTFGWQDMFGYADYTYGPPAAYFSNLRWSNNLRYTSSFAVPTQNFANDANTLYLISQDYRYRDFSSNGYTVSAAAGTPRIMPFGPFATNTTRAYTPENQGGSGYFPGSNSSYLVTTNSSTQYIPQTTTTPFTIECWVYNTGTSSTVLYAAMAAENYAFTLGFGSAVGTYDSTQTPWFGYYGFGWSGIRSTTAIPRNAWTHIACVFTGSTCYIYQDGIMRASGGPSTWEVKSATNIRIGCRPDATTDVFNGYISSARVVIGSNLYPSGTTFTPSTTPLTNITNTRLLMNFTNAAVMDNTGLNIIDTISQGQITTAQSKFNRGSLFSGSTGGGFMARGQGLSIAFGTGDFTIEFYFYLPSLGAWVFDTSPLGNTTPTNRILISIEADGSVKYLTYQANSTLINSGAGVVTANRWHHFALCKYNSQTRLFIDGIQRGSTYSDTLDYPAQANRPILNGNGYDESFSANQYVDELRITRGYARYRSDFKPQTSRWQDQ